MHASRFAFLAIVIVLAVALLFILAPKSESVEDLLPNFGPCRLNESCSAN